MNKFLETGCLLYKLSITIANIANAREADKSGVFQVVFDCLQLAHVEITHCTQLFENQLLTVISIFNRQQKIKTNNNS